MELNLKVSDEFNSDINKAYQLVIQHTTIAPKTKEDWLKGIIAEAVAYVISQSIRMEAMKELKDATQEKSGSANSIAN